MNVEDDTFSMIQNKLGSMDKKLEVYHKEAPSALEKIRNQITRSLTRTANLIEEQENTNQEILQKLNLIESRFRTLQIDIPQKIDFQFTRFEDVVSGFEKQVLDSNSKQDRFEATILQEIKSINHIAPSSPSLSA